MATIKVPELPQHLKTNTCPAYLLHSDEPLLLNEQRDLLVSAMQKKGFCGRHRFEAPDISPDDLKAALQNQDLFADKCIIQIGCTSAKPGTAVTTIIKEYLSAPSPDIIILLLTNKLSAKEQKTKWVQAINKCGALTPIYAPFPSAWPQWVKQRFQQHQLTPSQDAVRLLATLTEGHLLATNQAIEKLTLFKPAGSSVSIEDIRLVATSSHQFNAFDLADALLHGHAQQARLILRHLEATQFAPPLILWSIRQALSTLVSCKIEQDASGQSKTFQALWQNQKKAMSAALHRHSLASLQHMLQQANEIDLMIKGLDQRSCWHAFERVALHITQTTASRL